MKEGKYVNVNPFNGQQGEFEPFNWPQSPGFFPPGPPGPPGPPPWTPGHPGPPGQPGPGGGQIPPPPMGPPPTFTPTMATWRPGSGSMRSCLFRHTYVWLNNQQGFWFYPTFVMGNIILGYRWRQRWGWTYQPLNPDSIYTFQCF